MGEYDQLETAIDQTLENKVIKVNKSHDSLKGKEVLSHKYKVITKPEELPSP